MADLPHIVDVTRENFQQVMQASFDVPVLLDFWAGWCQPCLALTPVLTKLAEEYDGRFVLGKVNTEEQQEIAARFGIRGIPNVKLFRDGQPIDEFTGALPEQGVRAFLDRHIVDEAALAEERARRLRQFEDRLADAPSVGELESRLEAEPGDSEARYFLALRKVVDEDFDTAMELLLELVARDRAYGDDAGRVTLLEVFELLGEDPRVNAYRRRMTSLLY